MSYSRAQLISIAKKDIKELIRIIDINRANIKILADAIEVLGEEAGGGEDIIPILSRYLKHIHLLIREAAMNAVFSFYDGKVLSKGIKDRLEVISNNDPSSDLREFASDLLEKFGE